MNDTLWSTNTWFVANCTFIAYKTIRYDTVYLTCSKKLTDSQLSLPHGMNKNNVKN